jgi:receptor protein-tyrosine kinase
MNSPARLHDLIDTGPASAIPANHDKPIGAILLEAGLIRLEDVEPIVAHARARDLRFGDAAVALGLLKADVLRQALAFQFDYPVVSPGASRISREVIAAYSGQHPVLEDLRALRNQILVRWLGADEPRNKVVAILSASRGEGRSFVAANLAVTFSQMGHRTLLVDADLRHPRQHQLFGIPHHSGLSAMLADRMVISPVHKLAELRDLSVIPCGGLPPNGGDLLSRGSFAEFLAEFAKAYDVVILDTPAAQDGPEAQMIAARARGCVLVARRNHTDFDAINELSADVGAMGAVVIGSALMMF